MPLPMVSHRIPIAVDPNVFGSGVCWKNVNDPRRWRLADPDADRDLSAGDAGAQVTKAFGPGARGWFDGTVVEAVRRCGWDLAFHSGNGLDARP